MYKAARTAGRDGAEERKKAEQIVHQANNADMSHV